MPSTLYIYPNQDSFPEQSFLPRCYRPPETKTPGLGIRVVKPGGFHTYRSALAVRFYTLETALLRPDPTLYGSVPEMKLESLEEAPS